jgi:hypothetical protein
MERGALVGALRRAARTASRPLRAIRRFGSWVRHSQEDVEAVYGPNPNHVPDEERLLASAVILHGAQGGGTH